MKNLTRYSSLIQGFAVQYGLNPELVEAQVMIESGGDPDAFRYEPRFFLRYIKTNQKASAYNYRAIAACSFGLMQVMLETAMEMGFTGRPEELFDPKVNLELGVKKMAALWAWAGGRERDYPKALAAYNEGPANAQSGPPFVDQPYIDAVYALLGK